MKESLEKTMTPGDVPFCCGCDRYVGEVCYECGYCEDCCDCSLGAWEFEELSPSRTKGDIYDG